MTTELNGPVQFDDDRHDVSTDATGAKAPLMGLRSLLRNSLGLASARACSLLASLIVLPHLVGYLAPTVYGVWATILSTVAILSFADLGVGQALVNPLTKSIGDGDRSYAQSLVTTNVFTILACSLLVLTLIGVTAYTLPWQSLLSVDTHPTPLITHIFLIQGAIFTATFALSTGSYVRLAQHRSSRSAVTVTIGSVVSAILTLIVIAARGNVLTITTLASTGPLLGALLTTIDILHTEPSLRPRVTCFRWSLCFTMLRHGSYFSVQTFSAVIAYTLDTVVVANALGPRAVSQYTVTGRAPLAALSMVLAAILPLWSLVSHNSQDRLWIRSLLRRSISFFVIPSVLIAGTYLLTSSWVISVLGAHRIELNYSLVTAFAIWIVVAPVGAILSHTLMGMGKLRSQAIIALVMAAVNLVLSIVFVRMLGVSGVMWATILSYSLVVFPLSLLILARSRKSS